jgi:hypothetical protein
MGKIRRGGYVFVTWIGDHGNHVHVYQDSRLVMKWDLELDTEEPGFRPASRQLRELIRELKTEGEFRYENKESHRQ